MGSVETAASNVVGEQAAQKLAWHPPVLKRLRATDAENAAGKQMDDPVNFS